MLGSRPAALVFFAACLAGCASLYSLDQQTEGVPYFLPKTLVRFQINYGDFSLSQVSTLDVPDRSRPRYLAYQPNPLADENLCISRTEQGFLKQVYFGAHDRTADVILDVVELLARGGQQFDEGERTAEPYKAERCTGIAISEWMDPYDRAALEKFNRSLCGIRVDVPAAVDLSQFTSDCPSDSVCFATKSTMVSYVHAADGQILHSFESKTVASTRDVGWLKVRGAFFNRRITQLDFTNGALTAFKVKRDSEVLGLVRLPIRVIERLLTVPGNAIAAAFSSYQDRLLYLQNRDRLEKAAGTAPVADPGQGIDIKTISCSAAGTT